MGFLTKKINNIFCKYEPKACSYKDMFYDDWSYNDFDIENDVPTELTLIVDLAGDTERLLKKYGFKNLEKLEKFLQKTIDTNA